jgi:hypothetical protein
MQISVTTAQSIFKEARERRDIVNPHSCFKVTLPGIISPGCFLVNVILVVCTVPNRAGKAIALSCDRFVIRIIERGEGVSGFPQMKFGFEIELWLLRRKEMEGN